MFTLRVIYFLVFGWTISSMTGCSNPADGNSQKVTENWDDTHWDRTYGGAKIDSARAIALTKDGGALLAGSSESKGAGGNDMYLVRVDKDGNQLWDKTYGGVGPDVAHAIVSTKDGGALIAGYTTSKGNGNFNVYLVRVDKDGNQLWDYGGDDLDWADAITMTKDGGALLAGITSSKGAGGSDMYLICI